MLPTKAHLISNSLAARAIQSIDYLSALKVILIEISTKQNINGKQRTKSNKSQTSTTHKRNKSDEKSE